MEQIYENLYKEIQDNIKKYIINNNINAICAGISGGIDSTVNVALLRPVCDELNIPIIGRYIHIESNKLEEKASADLVGKAFCDDYKAVDLTELYKTSLSYFEESLEDSSLFSKIRKGNMKARLRMMYIRSLAHKNKGIMLDNTNKTEWNLGYFTIADNGDVSPLFNLWKTNVFNLAEYLSRHYKDSNKVEAIKESLKLKPTAGLGITNNDLEEIGAESYDQVDNILLEILEWKEFSKKRGDFPEDDLKKQCEMFLDEQQLSVIIPMKIIVNVAERHFKSEFKRKKLPIVL